jgi:4-aminobutyrate aminotransferase-like enzyme
MPLSAVIGRPALLDQFPPGSMTSTHSGNPICTASALASLQIIHREKLVERSARVGEQLQASFAKIQRRFSDVILAHHGKGMVASLHCVKPGTREPDGQFAFNVVGKAVQMGLLLFAPVGFGGACVKACPPLVLEESALEEGMQVLESSFAQVLDSQAVSR